VVVLTNVVHQLLVKPRLELYLTEVPEGYIITDAVSYHLED
jgi:hypothetical protein